MIKNMGRQRSGRPAVRLGIPGADPVPDLIFQNSPGRSLIKSPFRPIFSTLKKVETEGNGWVGIGFAQAPNMVNADIYYCKKFEENVG